MIRAIQAIHTVRDQNYIDGLVEDDSNSSAFATELLQSWTKPSIYTYDHIYIILEPGPRFNIR